jgi:hypothetical protein
MKFQIIFISDECLQTLDSKEDFIFKHLDIKERKNDCEIVCVQEINEVIEKSNEVMAQIDETELWDFMNCIGNYIPIESIPQISSDIIKSNKGD